MSVPAKQFIIHEHMEADNNQIIPLRPTPLVDYPRPLKLLWMLRKDLLSIWPESAYQEEFFGGPVMNKHMYVANSPDTVEHVLVKNNDNYQRKSPYMVKALRPLLGDGLFVSDGELWRERRRIEQPAFHPGHFEVYGNIISTVVEQTCGRWLMEHQAKEVNILPEMAWLTAEIISQSMFDYPLGLDKAKRIVNGFADFQATVEQFDLSAFFGWPQWLPDIPQWRRVSRHAKKIHVIVEEIIEAGQQGMKSENTLLYRLLATRNESNPMTRMNLEQIRNEAVVILMAGHETTANSLAWAIYLISQYPQVEKKLLDELKSVLKGKTAEYGDLARLKYTRAIFEEAMRLYPPVPVLSRVALEEDHIRDRHVPAGSIMLVIPWLLHRHQALWEKPNHFIPERFTPEWPGKQEKYAYVPFSAGPRFCLGAAFGMMEATLCLATLMQRFTLRVSERVIPGYECRLTLRPKNGLPMMVQRRE
jgi:cytochrome P450